MKEGRRMRRGLLAGLCLALVLVVASPARATTTTTTTTTTLPDATVSVSMAAPAFRWTAFTATIIDGAYPANGWPLSLVAQAVPSAIFAVCEPLPVPGSAIVVVPVVGMVSGNLRLRLMVPHSVICTGAGTPDACCTGAADGTCWGQVELDTGHSIGGGLSLMPHCIAVGS